MYKKLFSAAALSLGLTLPLQEAEAQSFGERLETFTLAPVKAVETLGSNIVDAVKPS